MSENVVEKKKKSSGAKKWFWGCGCGCLTIIIIIGVLIGGACIYGMSFYKDCKTEFTEMGFNKVEEAMVTVVTEDVTEPTLFCGWVVRIDANITTNIAIVAQVCEINGTIDADVCFKGQILTVKNSGRINGDLDVYCQAIMLEGDSKIEGDVTGDYQFKQ